MAPTTCSPSRSRMGRLSSEASTCSSGVAPLDGPVCPVRHQRPVDAPAAVRRERAAAPEPGHAGPRERHQPGRADHPVAVLDHQDLGRFGGVEPAGQVVGQPGPVLVPHLALEGGDPFEVGAGGHRPHREPVGQPHLAGQHRRLAEDQRLARLGHRAVPDQQRQQVRAVVLEGLPLESPAALGVEREGPRHQRLELGGGQVRRVGAEHREPALRGEAPGQRPVLLPDPPRRQPVRERPPDLAVVQVQQLLRLHGERSCQAVPSSTTMSR